MSKSEKIAEALRADLISQQLCKDSPVPSIRELASRYSISLMTADRVLDHLVAGGFLYRIPHHGAFIKEDPVRMPVIGYCGFMPDKGRTDDILLTRSYERLQAVWSEAAIVPRYITYAELCQGADCLSGLDALLISASHVDERTIGRLWPFRGRLVVAGGAFPIDNLGGSMILPDWDSAFREMMDRVDFLKLRQVLLVGAAHGNARMLDARIRSYLARIKPEGLKIESLTLQTRSFSAQLLAYQHFQECQDRYDESTLIMSFSDHLSWGIREAFLKARKKPILLSFDNSEDYLEEQAEGGVLTSVDWRLPDSLAEGARLLLRLIQEKDPCNYVVKLPCRLVCRS